MLRVKTHGDHNTSSIKEQPKSPIYQSQLIDPNSSRNHNQIGNFDHNDNGGEPSSQFITIDLDPTLEVPTPP